MGSAFGLWFGGSHLGYGTHMPVLASAVLQAQRGPVLEMGVGFYSTPLLHMLARETGRRILSLESDGPWLEQFMVMEDHHHHLQAVANWEAAEEIVDAEPWWAVAFVDHGSDDRREHDAVRLARRAELVLVHDWVPDGAKEARIRSAFAHCWVSEAGPQTAVLSNVRPFELVLKR